MIKVHLNPNQLGSYFIGKDLLQSENIEVRDVLKAAPEMASVGMGEDFYEDQALLQSDQELKYHCLGLEDESPLNSRDFEQKALVHIDLRIIDPIKASAITPHEKGPSRYLRWEELMCSVLELTQFKMIKAFHISGYAPDRDRGILLNHKKKPLNFHLKSSQETHQFTLALLYNCIEVLIKNTKED